MAGLITADTRDTFAVMILISAAQKMRFGTELPEMTDDGEKKHVCEVAVTYLPEPGKRPVSEIISVTVVGGDSITIPQGTPVEFTRLRCGLTPPEKRDNGRIGGGKLYWNAAAIRPASSAFRQPKTDAAA